MKLVKRKTRKAIRKGVNRLITKHGGEIAAGLAGSIASTLATLASTNAPGTKGPKSNLGKLSEKLVDTLTGKKAKKTRAQASSRARSAKDQDETTRTERRKSKSHQAPA